MFVEITQANGDAIHLDLTAVTVVYDHRRNTTPEDAAAGVQIYLRSMQSITLIDEAADTFMSAWVQYRAVRAAEFQARQQETIQTVVDDVAHLMARPFMAIGALCRDLTFTLD